MADQINISQVFAEAEYDDPPKVKVSQVFAEVEYAAAAPSTPAFHPIVTILFTLELGTATIRRATSYYVSGDGTVYLPGLKFPEYVDESQGVFLGLQNPGSVTLQMEIGGQGLSTDLSWADIVAAYEILDGWVTLTRYDPILGELSVKNIDYHGQIESYEFDKTHITIQIRTEDDPLFDKLLPSQVVTTDLFTASAVDVGKPINMPFGYCRDIPCWNIKNDLVAKEYDYVISHAFIEGLWTGDGLGVKRNGVSVTATEYTFLDGGRSTEYPGYAVLRFAFEQKDFSGRFMQITACVKGLKFGGLAARRNFVRVFSALVDWSAALGDPYGADSSDENDAVALLPEASWMCDFNIGGEQRKARDWFADIFQHIPLTTFRAYDHQFSFYVPAIGTPSAYFGDNDGYYDNCRILKRWVTPSAECFKKVTVQYDFVPESWSNTWTMRNAASHYEIEYQASSFGTDRIIQAKNTTSLVTAKKMLSLVVNTQIYSSKWISIQTGPEGRTRKKGDIIRLYSAYPATYQDYIIHATRKDYSGDFVYDCREYSDNIYDDLSGIAAPTEVTDSTSITQGPGNLIGTYVHADSTTQAVELSMNGLAGYAFGSMVNGVVPEGDYVLMRHKPALPITLPIGMTGSSIYADTPATAETVCIIKKNATQIGTATFAVSGDVATIAFTSAISLLTTDVFYVIGPSTPDATLAGIGVTVVGVKDLV